MGREGKRERNIKVREKYRYCLSHYAPPQPGPKPPTRHVPCPTGNGTMGQANFCFECCLCRRWCLWKAPCYFLDSTFILLQIIVYLAGCPSDTVGEKKTFSNF